MIDHYTGKLDSNDAKFQKLRCVDPKCPRIPRMIELYQVFAAKGQGDMLLGFLRDYEKLPEKGHSKDCPKQKIGKCRGRGFEYLKDDSESDEEDMKSKIQCPEWFECNKCTDQFCSKCKQEAH